MILYFNNSQRCSKSFKLVRDFKLVRCIKIVRFLGLVKPIKLVILVKHVMFVNSSEAEKVERKIHGATYTHLTMITPIYYYVKKSKSN